jgi:Secretion system C-terminal sorting domain
MKKISACTIFRSKHINTVFVGILISSFVSNDTNAGTANPFETKFYVSTTGSPAGDGSAVNPWDLQTALNQPATVVPGSTICLGAGRYTGNFTSNLTGTSTNPILVKPCDGARVIIDGSRAGETVKNVAVLLINGAYTWYMGFEVTNSDPEREITQSGSNPPERRGAGLSLFGAGIKIINLVIYDTGEGIDAWTPVIDGEFYGNIIFNNGWYAPDSHHGHGIYSQNNTGTKRFINNIILNNFGFGWQVFGSINASLNNFYIEGTLVFNDRWLIGGSAPLHNIELNGNFTYKDTIQIGYASDVLNTGLTVRNNYFASLMKLYYWDDCNVKSNTLFAGNTFNYPVLLDAEGVPNLANFQFDSNTYHWSTPPPLFQNEVGVGWENNTLPESDPNQHGQYLLSQWNQMGKDEHAVVEYFPLQGSSNYQLGPNRIFVRKNFYDPKRANVLIYNWEQLPSVSVDVSGILNNGDSYELHNVEDYFGDVITGTYTNGLLTVPMTNHSIAYPFGYNLLLGQNTFPEFGAFVLINTNNLSSLPVTFTNFSATLLTNQVLIKWSTADEKNVSHYIVERSADGKNFDSVAIMYPTRTVAGINNYQLTDYRPLAGKNFYRIREVNLQNQSKYSEVRIVYYQAGSFMYSINPNPSGNRLKITTSSLQINRIEFRITDAGGRVLLRGNRLLQNGSLDINLTGITTGIYYVTLTKDDEMVTKSFIKN